jgi:hypothetical protein
MKKWIKNIIFVVLALTLILSGCGQVSEDAPSNESAPEPALNSSVEEAVEISDKSVPEVWKTLSGSFVREDSSQCSNGTLQMKYLSNDCVIFEFDLMEGSESEGCADTLILSSVLLVDDNGVGHYESKLDTENPLTIDFYLSEDGKQVTVAHTGELSISPDGVYN